jgi:hypothetical protein
LALSCLFFSFFSLFCVCVCIGNHIVVIPGRKEAILRRFHQLFIQPKTTTTSSPSSSSSSSC